MRKRWCVYLAVLFCCLALYGAVTGWVTWMAVLTVAASPLVSVALSAALGEADALGLFSLPSKGRVERDYALREYRLGDAPSRVHWKRTAKTGKLLVRQAQTLALTERRRLGAVVPVALCFAILFCLFPPAQYDRQMQLLQGLFQVKPEVRLDLTIGPRAENKQAVLDVVASKSQRLYLRGQVYERYDGKSWRTSEQNAWCVWEPEGEVGVAARPPRDMPFTSCAVTQKPSQQCLQLPKSTRAWAAPLTEGKTVAQIGAFVRNLAEYDENAAPMPENGDFVRWFAESGQGYCIHFASAAAVLLRSAGIPARLVTGYVVNVQAGLRKTVTGSDAHAWVEYWDGQRWHILEATPTVEASAVPAIPVQKESRPFGGWWILLLVPVALCFKKRKEAPRIKALRQKAAFSRDGLTVEEKMELKTLSVTPLRLPLPLGEVSKISAFGRRGFRASAPKGRAKWTHTFPFLRDTRKEREGKKMKQDEKKPIPWEVADPKPPVIQSGKMENRKQN